MVRTFFRNFLWGYIYRESDRCEHARAKTIISLLSLHFKKSFPLIGSRKPLGKARSFHRIDNYVLAKNLHNKYSCSYLNSLGWTEIVGRIFPWSASPYTFSKLFIVACSVVFEPRVFRLTAFCASYVNWYELRCICNTMVATDWKKIKELMSMPHGRDAIYSFRPVFSPAVETKYYKFPCCHLNTCRFQGNPMRNCLLWNFPRSSGPKINNFLYVTS